MDMAAGYLVLESRAGVPEYWLKVPLAEGWTAAYRLTYHGEGARRRARIRELRIVPGTSADFFPNRIYATWEARTASARAPFSFDAIKRQITARRFTDALASIILPDDEPPEAWGPPATQIEAIPSPRKAGRPLERTPDHYAEVALRYDRVENNLKRRPGTSTRELLATHYKVPVTTIGKWLRIARQSGFLTPVVRGQRGGRATTTARARLSKRGEK